MPIPKIILLLLTWPMGLVVGYAVIRIGFDQDPYTLAVHEMLVLLIAIVLMVLAARFQPRVAVGWLRAVGHAFWYLVLALPSALLCFLFLGMPVNVESSGTAGIVLGLIVVLVFVMLLIGFVLSFYRALH